MNSLKIKIEFYERKRIISALKECNWVKARAAKMLGISDRVIGYKIKKYGIREEGDEESRDQVSRNSTQ